MNFKPNKRFHNNLFSFIEILALFLIVAAYIWLYALITKFEPTAFGTLGWLGVAGEFVAYFRCVLSIRSELGSWFWTKRLMNHKRDTFSSSAKWRSAKEAYDEVKKLLHTESLRERPAVFLYDNIVFLFLLVLGLIFSYRIILIGIVGLVRSKSIIYLNRKKHPVILFLSTSERDKLKVQFSIMASTGVRVVSLLKEGESYLSDIQQYRGGLVRVESNDEEEKWKIDSLWRQMVEILMEMVVIIVVDARNASPFVVEETIMALENCFFHKVIFIADSYKKAPLLVELLDEADFKDELLEELCIVRERMLSELLLYIIRTIDLPTEKKPTKKILQQLIN
jgi:hypothetical protein